MFRKGQAIVHPGHGAGKIVAVQTMEVAGNKNKYYQIELISGNGTLMIPVKQANEIGLRPATNEIDEIMDILVEEPSNLNDNYRTRQANISTKIYSGDPMQIAEALRDLVWRGRDSNLAEGDTNLKLKAKELLASEVAVRAGIKLATAQQRLETVLRQAQGKMEPDAAGV